MYIYYSYISLSKKLRWYYECFKSMKNQIAITEILENFLNKLVFLFFYNRISRILALVHEPSVSCTGTFYSEQRGDE